MNVGLAWNFLLHLVTCLELTLTIFILSFFPSFLFCVCIELTLKVSACVICEHRARWSTATNSIHIHLPLSGTNKLALMLRGISTPPTDEDWFTPESSHQASHPLQMGVLSYFTPRYFMKRLIKPLHSCFIEHLFNQERCHRDTQTQK